MFSSALSQSTFDVVEIIPLSSHLGPILRMCDVSESDLFLLLETGFESARKLTGTTAKFHFLRRWNPPFFRLSVSDCTRFNEPLFPGHTITSLRLRY